MNSVLHKGIPQDSPITVENLKSFGIRLYDPNKKEIDPEFKATFISEQKSRIAQVRRDESWKDEQKLFGSRTEVTIGDKYERVFEILTKYFNSATQPNQ